MPEPTNYVPDPMPEPHEVPTIQTGCSGGAFAVEELDGSPSVVGVSKIKVANGTLTDDGGGIVTLTTGGGSGADGTLYGTGSPEGAVSGSRGDTYIDTATITFWSKISGDATATGWAQVV